MRLLGLDWGTVRVGAALSDEEGTIAFPLPEPINSKTAIEEIKQLCLDKQVAKIVLGAPLSLDGQDNQSTDLANKFKTALEAATSLPIIMVDERFSSLEASKLMTGTSEKKQRAIKDNIAAQILLQSFLDKKTN